MDYLPDWDLKHISDRPIKRGSDYNRILTDYQFWADLEYDKVLLFQHDSMILRSLDESMLNYSYVGAPWKANVPWARKDRAGGNGGISIRDVHEHRKLLSHTRYNESRDGNEDVFFTHNLPNVAPYEICSKFGVETEYKLGTCTYHAIEKHLTGDQCYQIKTQYNGKGNYIQGD
jgi:hypothetical protein